jgi:hypothetical protein
VDPMAPLVDTATPYTAYSAKQVAVRALAVQGVVAAASGVDSDNVVEWLKHQGIWSAATDRERAFLETPERSQDAVRHFRWQQEAEWTLLWAVGKVAALGLPTRECDTRRLVDDILPPLGGDVGDFLAGAVLRSPQELLAEDQRTYRLWCHAVAAYREGTLPEDLIWSVLHQRRYAFEWLQGPEEWDKVECDA